MTVQRTTLSFIFINFLFCSMTLSLQAAQVGFSWLPNNEPNLSGYKVYYGTSSRNYNVEVDVGLPGIIGGRVQAEIYGLQSGKTYYFAATAYNGAGESGYSTEVKYSVPSVSGGGAIDTLSELDFNDLGFVTYSNQGGSGTVNIEDNGATLHINGNNWVRTEEIDTITADTVIEFDFLSTVEGEIHGIGFDEDDELGNDQRIFQVAGSQTWSNAIQVSPQYTSSDRGTWVHYSIPIGQYYTGSNMHLVLVNDNDSAPAKGNSRFRNIIISEGGSVSQPPSDNGFNGLSFVSYSNQGGSGTVSIEDNGATLHIDGNNWVRTEETYNISSETVIEFDFLSTVEGEIHGIGFDKDDDLRNDQRIFKVFGSQTWTNGIPVSPQYTSSDRGTWVRYSIPVGQYYTGSNMHLVIANDNDSAPAIGNSRFRNVIISEGGSGSQPPSDNDFNSLNFVTYSNQGGSGAVSIEDNGATLHIDGNNWIRTEETYNISSETVIEFDFLSTVNGEIHGIGFDKDDDLRNNQRIFKVFGSQTWTNGIPVSPQYTHSDKGTWVHYSIPVGQYYTGSNMHLVFANDNDSAPAIGNSRFRNVTITGY